VNKSVNSEERKKLISALFLKQQELIAVAKEMGLSRIQLYRWMKKNGAIMKIEWE
jgi:transcriptional regulator of acetoin/glycerol metabolism